MPADKEKEVEVMFVEFKAIFLEWLESRPTGEFVVNIPVNQGGLRDKPKVTRTETI